MKEEEKKGLRERGTKKTLVLFEGRVACCCSCCCSLTDNCDDLFFPTIR